MCFMLYFTLYNFDQDQEVKSTLQRKGTVSVNGYRDRGNLWLTVDSNPLFLYIEI